MNSPRSKILKTPSLLIFISGFASSKKADEQLVLKTTTANMTSSQTFMLDVSPGTDGWEVNSGLHIPAGFDLFQAG